MRRAGLGYRAPFATRVKWRALGMSDPSICRGKAVARGLGKDRKAPAEEIS